MSGVGFSSTGVVSFGVSTPFVYWGFQLVRDVVEAIAGQTLALHISSLEELREGFARRDNGSVVVTSDFPDTDLAAFVCDSELPLIVFSDDPDTFLEWTMRTRGMPLFPAGRFCSRVCSALAPNLRSRRRLVIVNQPESSPERVVAAVVEFLWPGRGEWLAQRTFEHLVETGKLTHQTPPLVSDRNTWPAPVAEPDEDAETRLAFSAAIANYVGLVSGAGPQDVVWPVSLFYGPDNRPWRHPIDLTGPARVVLYGPYMHLPIGDWAARVEFEIDGAVSGVEAYTDVLVNEIVTRKTFEMPAKGIFAFELTFRVENPHLPVEIRLFTQKSAIEGVFLPRSVRVSAAK